MIIDKNRENPFFCLVAPPEPCAKCYVLVFKNKFFSQRHIPHRITSFLQDLEGKTPLRGKTVALYDNENQNDNDNDNLILNYWGKATQALFLLLGAIPSNNN